MTYTAEEYRQWILQQTNPFYKISEPNENTIQLAADCGTAEIVFHEMDIIELMNKNKKDDSYSFYLHFQLQEREHAQSLFREMQTTLLKLKGKQKLKILFQQLLHGSVQFADSKHPDGIVTHHDEGFSSRIMLPRIPFINAAAFGESYFFPSSTASFTEAESGISSI